MVHEKGQCLKFPLLVLVGPKCTKSLGETFKLAHLDCHIHNVLVKWLHHSNSASASAVATQILVVLKARLEHSTNKMSICADCSAPGELIAMP